MANGRKTYLLSNVEHDQEEPYFVPSHGIPEKEQSKQIPSIGIDLQYQDQLCPREGFSHSKQTSLYDQLEKRDLMKPAEQNPGYQEGVWSQEASVS